MSLPTSIDIAKSNAKANVIDGNANANAIEEENSPGATYAGFEPYMPNGVCVCFPEYDITMGKENLNSATIQIKNEVKNLKGILVEPGNFNVKKINDKWELDEPDQNAQKVYDSFIGKDAPSAGGSGKYIRQTKSKKSKRRKGGRSKRRPLR